MVINVGSFPCDIDLGSGFIQKCLIDAINNYYQLHKSTENGFD